MPYTILPPKLPVWAQWAVVLFSLTLSAIYLAAPQRPPAAMLSALGQWVPAALGRAGAGEPALLPLVAGASAAKPLARFGDLGFIGCDLSLKDGRPNLVTNWQPTPGGPSLDLNVRLEMPLQHEMVDIQMPLNGTQIETALPPAFFSGSARGKVWIQVIQRDTGQALAAAESLGLASSGGWSRICR
jgi:hypothetical protein